MHKKLTTIILAALIILIGKTDAATLTQKVGEGILQSQVTAGKQVTVKYINTKHEFASWTVETGNVTIDTTSKTVTFTMPNENVVLVANFAEESGDTEETEYYTITYNGNGGTGTMASQTVEAGSSVTLTSNIFANSGYTFLGWSTSSTATTATYSDEQTIAPTSSMTLYALWQAVETSTTYTLTYNANGGSGAPTSQTGTTLTISSTIPTRDGYTFAGWGTSSSATSATYQAGGSITLTVDTTLYAVWTHTITLTYNANGGSGAPSSQSRTTTSSSYTFTLSNIEPTAPSGKAFRGWATSSSATVSEYKIGASITISSNTTLYAVYVTSLESGAAFTEADIGAYVKYTPSETSYTVETTASGYTSAQTYNPSSYTNWRVFSKDGTTVEIISDESVGILWLKGSIGYINAVQTLQDVSVAYVNSTYATSARSLGYSEEGLTDTENYKVINTTSYPLNYGVSGFPYADSQYSEDDIVIMRNDSLKQNSGLVWFASRKVDTSNSGTGFRVRGMNNSGSFVDYAVCAVKSDGSVINNFIDNGVRPIVTLKSCLAVSSGDGSPSNPYVLTTQHTMGEDGMCTICGYTCDHIYMTVVIDPTCEKRGHILYVCTRDNCDEIYADNYTSALGHDLTAQNQTTTALRSEATCTENATYYYECTRCTHNTYEEDGDAGAYWEAADTATGHSMDGSTCTVCGYTE